MVKRLLTALLIGGIAAWAQTPKEATTSPDKTEKVDKAAAYYHYMMACWYADLQRPGPIEANKVGENLDAAHKADPQAPRTIPAPGMYIRPRPTPPQSVRKPTE